MWEPRRLTTLWASIARCKSSFTFFYLTSIKQLVIHFESKYSTTSIIVQITGFQKRNSNLLVKLFVQISTGTLYIRMNSDGSFTRGSGQAMTGLRLSPPKERGQLPRNVSQEFIYCEIK
jgi:hypothetical protein